MQQYLHVRPTIITQTDLKLTDSSTLTDAKHDADTKHDRDLHRPALISSTTVNLVQILALVGGILRSEII